MKVMIITSVLALGTGLTGVFGAPVVFPTLSVTARDDLNLTARIDPGDILMEREEDRPKKHHDPYWCGAPFCGDKRDLGAASIVTRGDDMLAGRDEERKPHIYPPHRDPYWCGAPFCGEKRDMESASVVARGDDMLAGRDEAHRDPYWCGAPFCARAPAKTQLELDFDPNEKRGEGNFKCWEAPDEQIHCHWAKRDGALMKRDEALTKCWQGPEGQVHCQWAKRDEAATQITKCWEAPDGQIHCQWAKRDEVVKDITKCWEAPNGQIHCQWAKRDEVVKDITKCWEAPNGQIHCQWDKRAAEVEPVVDTNV